MEGVDSKAVHAKLDELKAEDGVNASQAITTQVPRTYGEVTEQDIPACQNDSPSLGICNLFFASF